MQLLLVTNQNMSHTHLKQSPQIPPPLRYRRAKQITLHVPPEALAVLVDLGWNPQHTWLTILELENVAVNPRKRPVVPTPDLDAN